jgi:hypothetical protein
VRGEVMGSGILTLTSSPSNTEVAPSGGSSLAWVPGSSVEKMEPKSRLICAGSVGRSGGHTLVSCQGHRLL